MPAIEMVQQITRPFTSHYSADEVQAMQRAVIRLFEHWQVTDAEAAILLGGIATRTFARWKTGHYGRVSPDLAARLSNLLGIHKALRLLFKEPQRGYAWMRKANSAFARASALEIMLGGQLTDLMRVRRYLDATRSPW